MTSMVSAIRARGTVTTASWISCSRRRSAPSAEPACRVPTPPGWPVPQALSRSSLGPADLADGDAVRAQPQRRAHQVRQADHAVSGAQRHQVRGRALQLAGILDQHHAVAGLGHLGQQRVDQGGLACGGAAGDQDVAALDDRYLERLGLGRAHNAGGGVIAEREDRDGGFADGEGGGDGDRREEPLEPLAGLGQLGGKPRRAGVDLGPDVVGDQAHDALAVVGGQSLAGVRQPLGQPVDPEPAIWV